MAAPRRELNEDIDAEPPFKLHFHFAELNGQLALSGAPWTGRFRSLLCLVKKPFQPLAVNCRTLAIIEGADLEGTPEHNRAYMPRIQYIDRLIILRCSLHEELPGLFNNAARRTLDVIADMGIAHFFHLILEEVTWDDFIQIFGYHQRVFFNRRGERLQAEFSNEY